MGANSAFDTSRLRKNGLSSIARNQDGDVGVDPYGASGISSQSVRRRGDTDQQRVGSDTRIRNEATQESGIGTAMQQAANPQPIQTTNGLWQALRSPTDLASIQARVLQSITKPGGQ